MRLARAVRVGSWVLIGLNLLMAVGAIGVFSRMGPAIASIIERNERTIKACVDMLAIMADTGAEIAFSEEERQQFLEAFQRARINVTEPQEPEILDRMEGMLPETFQGDPVVRKAMVAETLHLARINREAIYTADHKAKQLGRAGAWGVVFMALTIFLAGVIYVHSLTARVVKPLEEIHTVIIAHRNGETMRRCTGADLPQDVVAVFTGINEVLDQCQTLEGGAWHGADIPRAGQQSGDKQS